MNKQFSNSNRRKYYAFQHIEKMFFDNHNKIKDILEKYSYKTSDKSQQQKQNMRIKKRPISKIDLETILKTKTINQQKQFKAIKNSDLFSDQRKQTFVKFNYRFNQPNGYNYPKVFQNVLSMDRSISLSKKGKKGPQIHRGTMNVIQLWSQKRLKQAVGSLACPQDRSKVLKHYAEKKLKHRMKKNFSCNNLIKMIQDWE